jgi:hypothetical protein
MRLHFAAAASLAAMASVAAFGQQPKLVPEVAGLPSKPAAAAPEAAATSYQFQPDPSGGFSRTIFETDENPDFKITIRDFAFPPDRQPHTLTLPSSAFVHLLGGEGEISIAKKRLELVFGPRSAVSAGAPIEVVNNGEYPVVIRALVMEAK